MKSRPPKNRNLNIPLDSEEYEAIEEAAVKARLPLATWVRREILNLIGGKHAAS